MGNSHSQSVSRITPSPSNGKNKDLKEVRGKKLNASKFANPENRVLPVASNVAQRLRNTDNGNILHNGGTISGRKTTLNLNLNPKPPEFVELLQKKNHSSQETNGKCTFYGHRKSHSDPDIIRMLLIENDNNTDDVDSENEYRCDKGRNFNKRSIIAVSPSKAKIKSRKKKRAPEPPQCNTLPRTLNKIPHCNDDFNYKEERPNSCHLPYEYNDTPRRPLPPIPPDEMPPPPPPPDYNRGPDEHAPYKNVSKNYEKNRRTVDKWKFSKPWQDFNVEKRPRCKSLDRLEEQKLRESISQRNSTLCGNNSLRQNKSSVGQRNCKMPENKLANPNLKEAIIEAAKQRTEKCKQSDGNRNSFKLTMTESVHTDDYRDIRKNEPRISNGVSSLPFVHGDTANSVNSVDKKNIRNNDYINSKGREGIGSYDSVNQIPLKRGLSNYKDCQINDIETPCEMQLESKCFKERKHDIFTNEYNDTQSKWDLIIPEAIPNVTPNTMISVSSTSEEETEINLQLRPTLPRRPVELSRFSPTDVWKSINLDFFKSHNQRSDISSDDADDIMEEKICRISRPVAPPRLIHYRSGDSGISPDASSPMLHNDSLEANLMNNSAICNKPSAQQLEGENAMWVPQHDLVDDSECGTDDSPLENIKNSCFTKTAKLSMPNLMFPSRSLPRTDLRNDIDGHILSEKDNVRSKGRRKKSYKSAEGQHFNSLRNLKKALGLRQKETLDESKILDPNWSLSRSLPNFINNLSAENAVSRKIQTTELCVLDQIRRSNSESKSIHEERLGKNLTVAQSNDNLNFEWRKPLFGQPTERHVIYLPEYRSNAAPIIISPTLDDIHPNTDSELVIKSSHNRKRFSYQSTMRQEEKKKLEKLAREAELREKKRQQEIEWMNKVEDEFRKQRDKEKVNIRHQLRILNLQQKWDSSETQPNEDSTEVSQSMLNHEIAEFVDNFSKENSKEQHELREQKSQRELFRSIKDSTDPLESQQPTGMKKWLRRQPRDYQCSARPEPEGARSSSDDCKQIYGNTRNVTSLNSRNPEIYRPKCSHNMDILCSMCKNNVTRNYHPARKESVKISPLDDIRTPNSHLYADDKKVDMFNCNREVVHSDLRHSKMNGVKENGFVYAAEPNDTSLPNKSLGEYNHHTSLYRTNSGRTFESHSYYTMERKEIQNNEAVRKVTSDRDSRSNLFSTFRFQKELKENVRKKAKDFEKRTRKYQPCELDSDESGNEIRETRQQRPHPARNQKKKNPGDTRPSSFSRNHPHRNGARVKSQGNGQIPNGRPGYTKSPNNRAILLHQPQIPTC